MYEIYVCVLIYMCTHYITVVIHVIEKNCCSSIRIYTAEIYPDVTIM